MIYILLLPSLTQIAMYIVNINAVIFEIFLILRWIFAWRGIANLNAMVPITILNDWWNSWQLK